MPKAALYDIARSADPKQAIIDAIGDLSGIPHLFSARILVAIYIRPNRTAGGVELPDSQIREDLYQGCVGVVLKKGPLVFRDESFEGQDVNVGDWVAFVPGDGRRIQINGVDCRIIEDTMIQAIVSNPDIITHRQ
jgi:co-chaperonin GroES (HSP10)